MSHSPIEFERFRLAEYPDSDIIFVDGWRNVASDRTGVGFFIPSLDYRFGTRLAGFTSVFSVELYSIFCMLKLILRSNFSSVTIFTNSLYGMFHLRDRLHSLRRSPFAHEVAHLICIARDRGLTVRIVWIPSHVGGSGGMRLPMASSNRLPGSLLSCTRGFLATIYLRSWVWTTRRGGACCGMWARPRLGVCISIGYLMSLADPVSRFLGFLSSPIEGHASIFQVISYPLSGPNASKLA